MLNDSLLIQCFNCGQTNRLDNHSQNTGIICTGCGKEIQPLIFDKISEVDKRGFHALLGYFSVIALTGVMGGVMMVHGWSVWFTFTMLGGIVYLIGKIFTSKYKIIEIEEYLPDKLEHDNTDAHCSNNFDSLVVVSVNELPEKTRKYLKDVSIVVEDRPNPFVMEKLKLKSNRVLLGLFQGVPLHRKSVWHSGTMPDKITIYQKNVEAICRSDEEIKNRIKKVVRHEVAHFVGFTEEQVKWLGY
ncbi:MAG: metallopeptidase family protein [Planctomycetota bacterium]|jgi:predicted Zn-dependent protease with MMP-like domain